VTAVDPETSADLGWPQVIEHWATRCATSRGAAAVRAARLFETPGEAQARVDAIAEARHLAAIDAAAAAGWHRRRRPAVGPGAQGRQRSTPRAGRGRSHRRGPGPAARAPAQARRGGAGLAAHRRGDRRPRPRLPPDPRGLRRRRSPGRSRQPRARPLRRSVAALTAQLDRRMDELVNDPRYAPLLAGRLLHPARGALRLAGPHRRQGLRQGHRPRHLAAAARRSSSSPRRSSISTTARSSPSARSPTRSVGSSRGCRAGSPRRPTASTPRWRPPASST
jgi:hypothetical protein